MLCKAEYEFETFCMRWYGGRKKKKKKKGRLNSFCGPTADPICGVGHSFATRSE